MMKTIYDVYNIRKKEGLIDIPWPTVTKGCFKKVMMHNDPEEGGNQSDLEDEDDEENADDKIKRAEREFEL